MTVEPHDDYYDILGVSNTASLEEIKRSYRRLALSCHPDKNKDRSDATESFQLLSRAYATLKDESSRRLYDRRWPSIKNSPPDRSEDARRASEEEKAKAVKEQARRKAAKAKAMKEEAKRKEEAAAHKLAAQQDAGWEQAAQEAEQSWQAARKEAAKKEAATAREQASRERAAQQYLEREQAAREAEQAWRVARWKALRKIQAAAQEQAAEEAEFAAKPIHEQLSIKKESYLAELAKLEPQITLVRAEMNDLAARMGRSTKELKKMHRSWNSNAIEDLDRCRDIENSMPLWDKEQGCKQDQLGVLLGIHEEWSCKLKGINSEISKEKRSSFKRSIGSIFKR